MKWDINYSKSFTCPSCGGECLHQNAVDVYFRGEDVAEGVFVHCNDTTVKAISSDGNPSAYRDGLVITFWCEHCDDKPQLAIIQHKGTTFYDWRCNDGSDE